MSDEIEKLALHDVKWTDKSGEGKFSNVKWNNQGAGLMTFIGDKVEFRDGYAAYTPMVYECDLSADFKTVLAVRVYKGHLP